MNPNPTNAPHVDLTEQLIGFAMRVHREHGPGLDEKSYENSMCIEMAENGIAFTQQQAFPVHYRGHVVSRLITDLIVDDRVVLENKVTSSIHETHIAQVLSYLAVTNLEVGLILNFGRPSLEMRRVINQRRRHDSRQSH
ncbi:GxxExxY protein [Haloferula sp. A504]|uniref:GxxExxY protein n=1 Tax=Haloferula sp. A504 TaxID=3373601 RepID=UPI0031BBE33F|nr:GxxExxY protein [Verrucomicrobiaceae bacterium E54]